jgi:hypothetical protein
MKNISDITKILNENNISYSVLDKIELSKIDFEKSLKNQVRPISSVVKDTVEDYAIGMELGDVFPPIIVNKENGKYIVWDGNHRINAVKTLGWEEYPFGVIVCDSEPCMLSFAGQQLNMINGLPQSREDRIRSAMQMVEIMGSTVKDASKRFKISYDLLQNKILSNKAKIDVYKIVGKFNGDKISDSAAIALRRIKDEDVFQVSVKYATSVKLTTDECVQLSVDIRNIKRTSDALKYVTSLLESSLKLSQKTAGANDNLIKARKLCGLLLNSYKKINEINIESLPAETKNMILDCMVDTALLQKEIVRRINNENNE